MKELLAKYGKLTTLTTEEKTVLEQMVENKKSFTKGRDLIETDYSDPDRMYLVSSGQLYASATLDTGERAITRLYFAGDIIGTVNMPFSKATQTVTVSSDAQLFVFPRSNLIDAFKRMPRIAAIFYTFAALENAILNDRLVTLGRTRGIRRLASLVLEITARRNLTLDKPRYNFALHLTQEEMGDAIGLTSIQVNRLLRQLEEEGLIVRHRRFFEVCDIPNLLRIGHFRDRYADLDLNWFAE